MISITLICALVSSLTAHAENQLLVLSGGNSPGGNHFSQYLQTNAVYSDLKSRLNYSVSVLFAAGNNLESTPAYADVHKTEKENNVAYDKFIFGTIDGNRAATKTNVLQFFTTEIKSNLENFFLIVSDHGMPNYNGNQPDQTFSNNCIDLWNIKLEGGRLKDIGNFAQGRCLSKNELNTLLREKVAAKKHIFAMSQCFSGGFHQMAVVSKDGQPRINPGVCGFTAITQDTYASGCSPDVDGPSYQGYERSFTEQLTGVDCVNKKRLRPGKNSFKEAHEAAVLEDLTVDIPLATSDYFLWLWSSLLSQDPNFVLAGNFKARLASSEFDSKFNQVKKMESVVKAKYPELTAAVDANLKDLQQNVKNVDIQSQKIEESLNTVYEKFDDIYFDVVYSVWTKELIAGRPMNLTDLELKTERFIYQFENSKRMSGTAYITDQLLPVTWVKNPTEARETALFLAERQNKMFAYVASSGDQNLKDKIAQLKALDAETKQLSDKIDTLSKQHGLLRRLLIYRQGLAAWYVLDQDENTTALSDLASTLECEKTVL